MLTVTELSLDRSIELLELSVGGPGQELASGSLSGRALPSHSLSVSTCTEAGTPPLGREMGGQPSKPCMHCTVLGMFSSFALGSRLQRPRQPNLTDSISGRYR